MFKLPKKTEIIVLEYNESSVRPGKVEELTSALETMNIKAFFIPTSYKGSEGELIRIVFVKY